MPKTGAIVDLSVVLAGSCFLLLINTSSGLGPIPLTFCPHTGKINSNLTADVLLTVVNLGPVIFSSHAWAPNTLFSLLTATHPSAPQFDFWSLVLRL